MRGKPKRCPKCRTPLVGACNFTGTSITRTYFCPRMSKRDDPFVEDSTYPKRIEDVCGYEISVPLVERKIPVGV